MPAQVVPALLRCLDEDVSWVVGNGTKEERVDLNFNRFLFLTECFVPISVGGARGAGMGKKKGKKGKKGKKRRKKAAAAAAAVSHSLQWRGGGIPPIIIIIIIIVSSV